MTREYEIILKDVAFPECLNSFETIKNSYGIFVRIPDDEFENVFMNLKFSGYQIWFEDYNFDFNSDSVVGFKILIETNEN